MSSFGASKSPQPIFTRRGLNHNSRKIQSVIGKSYDTSHFGQEMLSEQKMSVDHEELSPPTPIFNMETTLWAGTDHFVAREDLEAYQNQLSARVAVIEEREHKINQLRTEIDEELDGLRRQQNELDIEKQRFREKHGFGVHLNLSGSRSESERPLCPHCGTNLLEHNLPWVTHRLDLIKDAEVKLNAREKYIKEREFELDKRRRIFDSEKRDWRDYKKRLDESVRKRKAELNGERTLLDKEKREFVNRVDNFQRMKKDAERRHWKEIDKFREELQDFQTERRRWAQEVDTVSTYKNQIAHLQQSLNQIQFSHEAEIRHYRVLEENLVGHASRMENVEDELTKARKRELELERELEDSIDATKSLQRQNEEMARRMHILEEHARRAEEFYTALSASVLEDQSLFLDDQLEKTASRMEPENEC